MTREFTLFAGTVGQSVWRSRDGGETFQRASAGLFMEAEIRALVVHPQRANLLYAGTDAGLYRSSDSGETWEHLPAPFDTGAGWQAGTLIWSLLLHPHQPETLFVGTCPPALYRSRDSGATWEKLAANITPDCPPIRYNRVTCIVADPQVATNLWAGVEIDGVWRSRDGGETWERLGEGLSSQDIHGLTVLPTEPARTLLATTNNDLNISRNDGELWTPQNVKTFFPNAYCRGIVQKTDDPYTLFLGNGNGPPGTVGSIQISRDGGETWKQAELPVPANSTIWTFATHPAEPNLIFAATVSGLLYRSEDAGATWHKCRHEFGELRALALTQ